MNINSNLKSILYVFFITAASALSACLLFRLNILVNLHKYIILGCFGATFLTAIIAFLLKKTVLLRLTVSIIILELFFAVLFFILEKSGFWNNISTYENLKAFIKGKGAYSSLIFLIIQILQVVAIPIPGAITVSVGNIVFGFVWGSVLSYVGIILGSVLAFIIGRKFGYKLVVWIAGEDNVKKVMNMIKGKDKIMFTVIFLLPFFPDDILCFVAGLTSMSLVFFTTMCFCTRIITILTTALFTEYIKILFEKGSVMGYMGIVISGAILIFIFYYTAKHGDKIQSFFEDKFNKIFKKKKCKDEIKLNMDK
jgi:uncharacterized membrane protein YdjX (TVP38/TMEM64 family)